MPKQQKPLNYVQLENARVFHNPKTNLIEITGKYVDGDNFFVTLPHGTKSDTTVRRELSARLSEQQKAPEEVSPDRNLQVSPSIYYGKKEGVKVNKEGILYKEVGSDLNWFCLPEKNPMLSSMFPLGIDEAGKPVLVNLKSVGRNNIFLSNHPGAGGLMTLANLVYHVINFMPDTKVFHTNDEVFIGVKPTDENAQGRLETLKGFWLLEHLRNLRDEVKAPGYTSERNEVIILQDFDVLVEGDISNSPSSRTDKAVRAEIMDLIIEISESRKLSHNICFVFSSRYLSESMNAFIDTAATIMAYTRHERRHQESSEPRQYRKLFDRSTAETFAGGQGRGVIKDGDLTRTSRKFATFLNEEVIKGFSVHPLSSWKYPY